MSRAKRVARCGLRVACCGLRVSGNHARKTRCKVQDSLQTVICFLSSVLGFSRVGHRADFQPAATVGCPTLDYQCWIMDFGCSEMGSGTQWYKVKGIGYKAKDTKQSFIKSGFWRPLKFLSKFAFYLIPYAASMKRPTVNYRQPATEDYKSGTVKEYQNANI